MHAGILESILVVIVAGLIVGLITMGLAGAVLALLRRRGLPRRGIVLTTALCTLVIVLIFFLFRVGGRTDVQHARYASPDQDGSRVTVSMAVTREEPPSAATLLEPTQPREVPAPSVWAEKAADVLRPDVHASAQQAAETAVADALERLPKSSGWLDNQPDVARVYGDAPSEVLIAVVDRVQQIHPDWNVYILASPAARQVRSDPKAARAVHIGVEVNKTGAGEVVQNAKPGGDQYIQRGDRGVVRVHARYKDEQLLSLATFVGKAWAHDLASFASAHPERSWLVASSPRPCTSQDEAEQAAIEDAAAKLLPMVHQRLGDSKRGLLNWASRKRARWSSSQDRELRVLRIELQRGAHVVDRFVQRFKRPYGSTWQANLLIDSSDVNLDRLARAVASERQVTHRSWTRHLLSVGGLLLLVCGLYLFLNAATKGYYVWSLRVVVALAVLGGIGLLVA